MLQCKDRLNDRVFEQNLIRDDFHKFVEACVSSAESWTKMSQHKTNGNYAPISGVFQRYAVHIAMRLKTPPMST